LAAVLLVKPIPPAPLTIPFGPGNWSPPDTPTKIARAQAYLLDELLLNPCETYPNVIAAWEELADLKQQRAQEIRAQEIKARPPAVSQSVVKVEASEQPPVVWVVKASEQRPVVCPGRRCPRGNLGLVPVAEPMDTLSRIARAQAHLDELLLRFTEKHPDVIAARTELVDLYRQREQEIKAK
jgi:hypothetical protein